MDRISPPWDPDTVDALNAYQAGAPMHPFTCPNRDLAHWQAAGDRDLGVLTATPSGWICKACDYRQLWAWPWMADTSWWQSPRDEDLIQRTRDRMAAEGIPTGMDEPVSGPFGTDELFAHLDSLAVSEESGAAEERES